MLMLFAFIEWAIFPHHLLQGQDWLSCQLGRQPIKAYHCLSDESQCSIEIVQ
jgi:hypothetical protein